jgi:hypothetical protein
MAAWTPRLGGHVLIALDGTEYFSSKKIHCHNCSTRQRGNGEKEYFHAMLGATLVAPGVPALIPTVARGGGSAHQPQAGAAADAAHGDRDARPQAAHHETRAKPTRSTRICCVT